MRTGMRYSDEDDIKAIRTRSGHTIEFHDTQGKEQIKIYDNEKNNFELTFSTHEQLIKLQSKGNIELYSEKNVLIERYWEKDKKNSRILKKLLLR